MSTHNICFPREIRKLFLFEKGPYLSLVVLKTNQVLAIGNRSVKNIVMEESTRYKGVK